MGTEAAWVPLVISALGAGAQAYGQHQQAVKAEDISNDLIRGQQRQQHQADADINAQLDTLGQSNPDAERQASLQGFLGQLRANQAAQAGGGPPGAASDRSQAEAATGQSAIRNFGTQRADILSRIMSPTLQRVGEQNMANRTADQVRGTQRDAQGEQWLASLRMAQNVQNPWVNAAGQIAQGAGSATAGRAGMMNPTDELTWKRNLSINQGYVPPKIDMSRAFG